MTKHYRRAGLAAFAIAVIEAAAFGQGYLVCGGLVSGDVTVPDQVNVVSFDGQSGSVVDLTLVKTYGDYYYFNPVGTLFSPSGVELGSFGSYTLNSFTLPETGTYIIRLRDDNYLEGGGYNIGLECRSPLVAVDAILVCGGLVSRDVTASAQVDLVTFDGQSGSVVDLTLVKTYGDYYYFNPVGTLFSPSGVELASFGTSTLRHFNLPESGTYLIRLSDDNFLEGGGYRVELQCLPGRTRRR